MGEDNRKPVHVSVIGEESRLNEDHNPLEINRFRTSTVQSATSIFCLTELQYSNKLRFRIFESEYLNFNTEWSSLNLKTFAESGS